MKAFLRATAIGALLVVLNSIATYGIFAAELNSTSSRIQKLLADLGKAKGFGQTAVSPDGNSIAWLAEDRGVLFLASTQKSEEPRRISVADSKEALCDVAQLSWSPDSQALAFFAHCPDAKGASLYLADAKQKSAPRRIAQLNGYVDDLGFSPDGQFLAFLYVEGATRPAGALAAMKPPAGVIGEDGLEIQRVAVVDLKGDVRQVTPSALHVYEWDWAPDSQRLAYIAAPAPGENNWWVAQLYVQSITGGDPRPVLDPQKAAGSLHGLQIAVPRWSPDGKQIAFIGGLMSDQGSTGGDLYLISSSGGEAKNLTPGYPATSVWLGWQDASHLFVSQWRDGESVLSRAEIASSGAVFEKPVLKEEASVGDGRFSLSISFSRDHRIAAFTKRSFSQPEEIWLLRGEKATPLTNANSGLKPAWGPTESLHWSSDGLKVQGWLLYPLHFDPAKKYPMVVYVHGGPAAVAMPSWPGVGYTPAAFSALDYFVFMPNPRGSFGQGEAFTQANRRDFGYGDLRDILAGVDAVLASKPVDKDRIGLTGWSYGGFLSMFAVTQTNRFRAAVAGAGISNWQSYYGENSIDQWMKPYFGASVYDDPAAYARSSAVNFIHNVKTPTLVVVGDRDGECPAPQSFEFWHALKAASVPTRLVVYPNEGHRFRSLEHREDVLVRAVEWFDRYLSPETK